jgi:copper chaperone CopZ
MIKSPKLYLPLCLGLAALVAAWLFYPSGTNLANAALAEYQIEKMTCGSCTGNIETALVGLSGVGSVDINLTSNRGRVIYDPNKLDSQSIAEAITAAGYPAKLRLELDSDEYLALQQEQAQLGQEYLARIGDRLLARSDFEGLVMQRSRGAVAAGQNDQLWKTVWQDVLQRELMLSSAEENKVVVQDGEVEVRLDELRKGHQGLDDLLVKRYGSVDVFRARLHEDMIINRNIEDHVYAGITDPGEQKNKLQQWYAELQNNTDVVIFDSRLKAVSQGGGGCGSGGGGGGGGCCSS